MQISSCASVSSTSDRRSVAEFLHQSLQSADLQLCFGIKHFRTQLCSCAVGTNTSERRSAAVSADQTLQNTDLQLYSFTKGSRMQNQTRKRASTVWNKRRSASSPTMVDLLIMVRPWQTAAACASLLLHLTALL